MTYRPMTPSEIGQFIHDHAAFAQWQMVRDFIVNVYGPTAQTAKLVVDAEYNDEGGNDYYFGGFRVTDAQGVELAPDLNSPFWAESMETYSEVWDDYRDRFSIVTDPAERLELASELAHEIGHAIFSGWLPLGWDARVYDLTAPPATPTPTLYVIQE